MTTAIPIAGKWNDVSKETSNGWIRTHWSRHNFSFQIYFPTPPFLSRDFSFHDRYHFLRNRVNNSQRNNQLKYNTSRSSIELWINNSAKDWLANYHIGNPSSKPVVRYTEPWRELGQGCQSMARTSPSATNVYVLDRPFAATSKTILLGSATPRTSNF